MEMVLNSISFAFLPAVIGAAVEAAELFIEAVDVLLAGGPARGLGIDARLLGLGVDHGTRQFEVG